ncbi:DUF2163 domain-containing protein [Pontixanthobacter sp.]|uniref:DUF2163 domain-containing protein n=1 Tax=Pontixanthobacter sp. TaxID=2792078 RepID=UPI003C7DC946
MSRVFFRSELETVTTYWRIFRTDGVTLGFTAHDRDLWFDGIAHRSAPGMVPSAIRHTVQLTGDSAEVSGALSHDAINDTDLLSGRYDQARIEIGVADWKSLDNMLLYAGQLGRMSTNDGQFTAELQSAKFELEADIVPRTSPTCRAQFCGPGCNLSDAQFTQISSITGFDQGSGLVTIEAATISDHVGGTIRWIDGPLAGQRSGIISASETGFLLDTPALDERIIGAHIYLREGCDHRYVTCNTRFGNSVNFRGEPFLPGNDLLVRVPESR